MRIFHSYSSMQRINTSFNTKKAQQQLLTHVNKANWFSVALHWLTFTNRQGKKKIKLTLEIFPWEAVYLKTNVIFETGINEKSFYCDFISILTTR